MDFQQGVHKRGSVTVVLFVTEHCLLEFCCLWLSELGVRIFLFLSPASWHSDFHEELKFAELVNKYPVPYGVRKFITVFKRALLLDLLLSQLTLLHTHHPMSFCLPNRLCLLLTLWYRNYFFLILAHPVYKM